MTDHISPVYKIVTPDGTTPQGYGKWDIPDGKPGEWLPEITGELVACQNGYHLLRTADLTEWLPKPPALLLECEYTGRAVLEDDKVVVRRARPVAVVGELTDRIYHLLACDYAERVLPIYENERPDDKRPRTAIETKRRWVDGKATSEELAAARAAAGDAARAAAGDAARAAAWAAARAAAWDAAWDAAGDAAWAAERQWQGERLIAYLRGEAP
jgi:hypothetical protein